MADFRLLAWLRWRQWRSSALYWLRTLGYDPQRQGFIDRLYALYLIVFGVVWIAVAGLGAVHQAATIGHALPLTLTQFVLAAMPWLFVAAAIYLLIRALRSSPVLLSFPDMAFVAASPVNRAAFVLVNFIQSCIQHWIVVLPIFALVIVVVAQPLGQPVARLAALRATAVIAPLIPLLLAVAWLLGLLRLVRRERRWSGSWWLAAFLLAPLAWLLPPLRWPGAGVSVAIGGALSVPAVVIVSVLAVLAIVALARVAAGTNLIAAAEESRTYARLNALGLMAILAPDVSIRIRRQEALSRRRARFALPRASGTGALLARSFLLSARKPFALFRLFLWGASAAGSAAWLVLSHPPLTLWFFWVSFLALSPPKMLVESFETDVAEPYLRQLVPMTNGTLAVVGGGIPGAVALLGALAGWFASATWFGLPVSDVVLGVWAAIAGVLILLLAQALGHVRVEPFGWRLPYVGWLIVTVVLLGGAMLAFGPLMGATVGVLICLAVFGASLAGSRPAVPD